jgi:single-stranded DNA-binding protein
MSIFIVAEGNVGSSEFKPVRTVEGDRMVLNMSVKFSSDKRNKTTGDWEDQGYWASVELWGKRAELTAKLITIGVRVLVVGNQWVEEYESTAEETLGQTMKRVKVRADYVGLSPLGLKAIEREKKAKPQGDERQDDRYAYDAGYGEPAFDDDIPH